MTTPLRSLFGLLLFVVGTAVGGAAVYSWDRRAQVPLTAEEPARTWEATVYLPLADNQGTPFPDEDWQKALHVLVTRFGGATLGEPREGRWVDDRQRIQHERIRPVIISFDRSRLDEFRGVVREVGRRLGQHSMYVRFEEPRIELIDVAPEGSRDW